MSYTFTILVFSSLFIVLIRRFLYQPMLQQCLVRMNRSSFSKAAILCHSSFYIQTSTRKTSFLGAAYSIVASCLCFGEGILLQTVVKVPACLPVFALLLVSCLQLRCWKISRTVWIYQDWTLLICICTYS